jgi:acylphosphatase
MTAHILVIGFVQGVGFRRFLRSKAKNLGLTGWVRNTNDGRVEAIVQGSKEKIDELLPLLKKGNILSQVKSIQCEFVDYNEHFIDFQMLYK